MSCPRTLLTSLTTFFWFHLFTCWFFIADFLSSVGRLLSTLLISLFCCYLLLSPVLWKKLDLDLLLQTGPLPELFSIWGLTPSFWPFGEYPIIPSQAPVPSSEHTKHRLTTFIVVCGFSLKCMKLQTTPDILRIILCKSTCLAHNKFNNYLLNKWINECLQVTVGWGRSNSYFS